MNDPAMLLADNTKLREINYNLRMEIMRLEDQVHSEQRTSAAWKLRHKKLISEWDKLAQALDAKSRKVKKLKKRCKKLASIGHQHYRESGKLIGRLVDWKARVNKLETHIRIHRGVKDETSN